MDRYEFLTEMHRLLRPRAYLEIGVQTGASLTLASGTARAGGVVVGVDPDMGHITHDCTFATLVESTSDEFFAAGPQFGADDDRILDLVFIDGLHHAEQVWRDLRNAATIGHENTIFVLDDVLPRNQLEAAREQCPGDWTGDVWKVIQLLEEEGASEVLLVDTFPTGIMVVKGIHADWMEEMEEDYTDLWRRGIWQVPDWILTRDPARVTPPQEALQEVFSWTL